MKRLLLSFFMLAVYIDGHVRINRHQRRISLFNAEKHFSGGREDTISLLGMKRWKLIIGVLWIYRPS